MKAKKVIVTECGEVQPALVICSVRELDRVVEEIRATHRTHADTQWHLAKKLIHVHERQLWKLRVDSFGKRRYRGFAKWLEAETNYDPGYAYQIMDLAAYDTPQVVKEIGTTKALLVLKAHPSDRAVLIERAKGVSTRTLQKEVGASKARHNYYDRSSHAKNGAKGAASRRAKKLQGLKDDEAPKVEFYKSILKKIAKCLAEGEVTRALKLTREALV